MKTIEFKTYPSNLTATLKDEDVVINSVDITLDGIKEWADNAEDAADGIMEQALEAFHLSEGDINMKESMDNLLFVTRMINF
jgi:hypothetical protein